NSRDSRPLDCRLDQTDGLIAHRSDGGEKRRINAVLAQHSRNLRRRPFDQPARPDNRTHEAEVATIEFTDHAYFCQFAKTVEREDQITIRFNPGVIKARAAV